MPSPPWLTDLSRAFRAHRQGRQGWHVQVNRDRLRITSSELPPRPGESAAAPRKRSVTLTTPPGPASIRDALEEACKLYDAVQAGVWHWPSPGDPSPTGKLSPTATIPKLIASLRDAKVGEVMQPGTWERCWQPYLADLPAFMAAAPHDPPELLLARYLKRWEPGSRARQMAHDRIRALWRHAGWPWPPVLTAMRGSGTAARDPRGVRGFTDAEIQTLRERVTASRKLTPSDLLCWDLLATFGLRPIELQGLILRQQDGQLLAEVTREKRSSKGTTGARLIPAIPPSDWPPDCYDLLLRWHAHGLPPSVPTRRSPGELLTQQLRRLGMPRDLTAYGLRHAWAIRAAAIGLDYRSAAALMGHSPATHCAVYGRRQEVPALLARVATLTRQAT